MKKPTAIIIGAGIGGLGTAIQLAKAGIKVTMYEKNDKPGGRCQQISKDGHIFDTGPTMYLFPEIFENFFSSIGENIHNYLELLRADPTYLLNFTDNTNLIITSNMQKMKEQLETIEPGSYQRFQQLIDTSKQHYQFAMENITQKDLKYPWDYFTPSNLYKALKYNTLLPHYSFISSFFKDPHIRAALTFQDSYLGLDPFHTPALFSMLSYVEHTYGNYLPKGGMYKIIEALENITQKYDIEINYKKAVKKINTKDAKAVSITLEDNTHHTADYIIVNADLTYAYSKLLPDDPSKKKLQQKKHSCSVLVFHWALDKTYPLLNTHNIFFSNDYKKGFDDVINKTTPPAEPHFYIQAPSRTDPTRAPAGQDTLSVMVPINHIHPEEPIDWIAYKAQLKKYIFARLSNAGIEYIHDHIKFEISYAPTDWQHYLNLTHGSVYGLHHSLTQLGYLRPSRSHSKYTNLFFVGSSNHPGSGLPTVLLSSMFTAQRIIKSIF